MRVKLLVVKKIYLPLRGIGIYNLQKDTAWFVLCNTDSKASRLDIDFDLESVDLCMICVNPKVSAIWEVYLFLDRAGDVFNT